MRNETVICNKKRLVYTIQHMVEYKLRNYVYRLEQCNLFCTALEKQTSDSFTPANALRCKRYFNMENFSSAAANLEYRAMKRVKKAVTINVPMRNSRQDIYHDVGSVLFIKEIRGDAFTYFIYVLTI